MACEHGDGDAFDTICSSFEVCFTRIAKFYFLYSHYMALLFICACGAYYVGAISAIFDVSL